MLNWLGTRKAADGMALLRDTHEVIAELPADDAVAAVARITGALDAINGAASLTLEERYDDIYLLDAATVERTHLLLREYLTTSRQMKQREALLWESAYNCWDALATAYVICVQHYAADSQAAAGFRRPARVAAARAIRALRRQLQWLRIRYQPAVPAIWMGLANLFAYIEDDDVDEEMSIYPGETSSIKREFLKALVQSALSSDNLQPPGQDLATFIVSRYAHDFVLSRTPAPGCTHWFDLKHPQPPALLSRAPAPDADLRYFGVGLAVKAVTQALEYIQENGLVAPELGFKTPIELAFLTPVLTQIYNDWSGNTPERRHERQHTNARLSIVPGYPAIRDTLMQAEDDPFDFTARPEVESWVANDISEGGFGAMLPSVSGDWVSVGGIAGVEGKAPGEWHVGVVRRITRADDGQQRVGMQILSRHASVVRMMREEPNASELRVTQRMPLEAAILLTPNPADCEEVELLVKDETPYEVGNVHMLAGDQVILLRHKELREKISGCARVCLTVLGLEA
jgi:hypothetical protein